MHKHMPAMLATLALTAAAHADVAIGPYVGVGVGASRFDFDAIPSPRSASDRSDAAQKLYAGYRFTEHWGVEAGYANLGHVRNTYAAGTFKGRAEAFYLAGTGRLPVTDQFALTAKLMLSYGRTHPTSPSRAIPEFADLHRSSRSLTFGSVGAEYAFTPQTTAAIEFDNIGAISKKSDAAMLSVNLKYHF
ncbi:MAG TPA: outer membrane beta-barrel protein [Noviherbaspirillum sp.]|nr:outer membrane beta-barrel protein [Noviherbaspirillum sp.]